MAIQSAAKVAPLADRVVVKPPTIVSANIELVTRSIP
jgi:hypothetical protein